MRTLSPLLVAALLSTVAACGKSEKSDGTTSAKPTAAPAAPAAAPAPAPAPAPAAAQPAATTTISQADCEAFFARQRECTDAYIPALVDLRISMDRPAGIAAEAAKPGGRDAVIAQAKTEWASDSQPAAITATCQQILSSTPADKLAALAPQAQGCMAQTECGAFSTCAVGLLRTMWQ